jgi:hypothetical protein
VGIFTRNERDEVVATDGNDGVETRDEPLERDRVVEDHRSEWGGPPLVRALFTLLGVAAAGLLIWIASTFELTSTSEFWYAMGLIAAAGLALGLSQLFGGWTKWGIPVLSPGVFLLAFIPTLIVSGWVLLTVQPDGGWQHDRFAGWSSDLGITGLVNDLGTFPAALAMGAGLVLAFSFDTTGPRRREVVDREREVVPDEDVHDYSDDRQVVTDNDEVVTTPADERTVTTPADDRTVTTTTPATERTTVRDRDVDTN